LNNYRVNKAARPRGDGSGAERKLTMAKRSAHDEAQKASTKTTGGQRMLRIAVIGAGRIGKIHAANVARHPRTQLSAVADPIEAAARALAQAHQCEWTTQADDLIAGKDVDAIVICTPTNTHVDLIERAAAAGKAILCEKPIDLDIAKVERCLASLARTPVPLLVGFNRRFDPSAAALKRAIDDGQIGALRQVIMVLDKKPVAASAEDGRRALVLANAALEAVKSGRAVRV
jgi:predicted dehydrogenase